MSNCLTIINDKLAPEHKVNATMGLLPGQIDRPIIGLLRLDKWTLETRRTKRSFIAASYCPFCGEKYPEAAADIPKEGANDV